MTKKDQALKGNRGDNMSIMSRCWVARKEQMATAGLINVCRQRDSGPPLILKTFCTLKTLQATSLDLINGHLGCHWFITCFLPMAVRTEPSRKEKWNCYLTREGTRRDESSQLCHRLLRETSLTFHTRSLQPTFYSSSPTSSLWLLIQGQFNSFSSPAQLSSP